MNNKKLWYPAAMVIALSVAFGAAQAKSLEQVGAAESQAEPLKTYGVDVAAKAGLKALLPSGWNLFIHKNTSLPQHISWTVTDTWITAIDKFAGSNNLAVRLDWTKKAVYISTPEVAMEARAKLAEIDNAARTPLPAYAPATTSTVTASPAVAVTAQNTAPISRPLTPAASPVTPVRAAATVVPAPGTRIPPDVLARALAATAPRAEPAKPANAAPAAVPAMPAVATPPTLPPPLPPLASRVQPVAATPAVQQPVTASDAFAHGNMEDIVRKTAEKLGYQVSWETISLPLDGPVTFLGVDAAEDMSLLQKSLGYRQSPIAIEVYRGSNVIRITPSAPGKEPLAIYSSSFSGLIGFGPKESASVLAANKGSTSVDSNKPMSTTQPPARTSVVAPAVDKVASVAPVVKAAPATEPAPAVMTLKIAKGDSLSKNIAQFLKSQGWEMKWQVPNDMEAGFQFTAEGTSIAQVLGKLLPKLGLDTDVYGPSKMVVIRVVDQTAD